MNPLAKQAANRFWEIAVGLAAGCLGLRIARLAESFMPWALVRFAGAEVMRGSFGEGIALAPDAPRMLHALQAFWGSLFPSAAVVAAVWLVPRLPRAAAPTAAFAAFWFAASLIGELAVYARFGRGSMRTLANTAGLPAAAGELPRAAAAALLAAAVLYLLRRAVRGMRLYPLTAFLAPCAILCFALPEARAAGRFLQRGGLEYLPLAAAAAAALAAWKWKPRADAGGKAPFALPVFLGAAAFFAPAAFDPSAGQDEAVRWVEAESTDWRLLFEENRFDETDRERRLRGATLRGERLRERLGMRSRVGPVRAYVAKTWQAFQQIAGDRRYQGNFYQRSAAGPVVLAGPGNRPDDALAEAVMLMREAWGPPASEAMARAIARFAAGHFHGNGLGGYAARIACEEQPYPAAEIFAVDRAYLSPLTRDAVSGAWVENFVSRRGAGELETLYRRELGQALAMCPDCIPRCNESDERVEKSPPPLPYQKGISFSHEIGGDWGYGSEAAARELRRIRRLGATAVALVPYAFTAAPERPTIRFRTDETDDRLRRSLLAAKDAGLKVMLKPHLWSGRRFHGDISFTDETRFAIWFEQYRRRLLHFARFAELHGVDLLAIGNELSGLTVEESPWRGLIADVRRIYNGPVTYAAHWNGEFERIAFWDRLDYIGVNFYFPLSSRGGRPAADSAPIAEARRRLRAVSAKFDKPILFTEVGFPALRTAASKPWEENASGLDAALQKQCYELWFRQFSREDYAAGMYWWKWPTHGRGGPFDASHSPVGKPAVEVLRTWFAVL